MFFQPGPNRFATSTWVSSPQAEENLPASLKFIRDCIRACNTAHRDDCVACSLSNRSPDARPAYLIDVYKHCIVGMDKLPTAAAGDASADRYVALSYVWPKEKPNSTTQDEPLMLNRTNLNIFMIPGFFKDPETFPRIPATVHYAIGLTQKVHERYLWVDRFCIVQDASNASSQIAHMNDIYGDAYLTIVAASSEESFKEHMHTCEWPMFVPGERSNRSWSNKRSANQNTDKSSSLESDSDVLQSSDDDRSTLDSDLFDDTDDPTQDVEAQFQDVDGQVQGDNDTEESASLEFDRDLLQTSDDPCSTSNSNLLDDTDGPSQDVEARTQDVDGEIQDEDDKSQSADEPGSNEHEFHQNADRFSKDPEKARHTAVISGKEHVVDLYGALAASEWSTRGWTYQEQLLSRRSVIFTGAGVFWDCQHKVWDGVCLEVDDHAVVSLSHGEKFLGSWWPDFKLYIDVICKYNGRSFTFPQDGLAGISATLRALSPSFPGGFVAGLPWVFLDQALLWQPFAVAERRRYRSKPGSTTMQPTGLPTWSWCGWQCFVDPKSLSSGLSYLHERWEEFPSFETRQIVKWSIANDKPQETNQISRSHDEGQAIEFDAQSPNGWLQHKSSDADPAGSPFFTYGPYQTPRFRHPIPVNERTESFKIDVAPQYLRGATTIAEIGPAAIFKAVRYYPFRALEKISIHDHSIFRRGPSVKESCSVLVLQQRSGIFAGLLRLMDREKPSTGALTLVAISRGSASEKDLRLQSDYRIYRTKIKGVRRGEIKYKSRILSLIGRNALHCSLAVAFGRQPFVSAKKPKSSEHWEEVLIEDYGEIQEYRSTYHAYPIKETLGTDNDICEFYNVLWVQEEDGILYRKGCGWVPKKIWEQNAVEQIITLG